MMENQVSNSKANATYQNSSKVKEVAYRILRRWLMLFWSF